MHMNFIVRYDLQANDAVVAENVSRYDEMQVSLTPTLAVHVLHFYLAGRRFSPAAAIMSAFHLVVLHRTL